MGKTQQVRVVVRDLLTAMHIGIHPHEHGQAQRVLVNLTMVGEIPLRPQSVSDCIDYDHIHRLVTVEWPRRAHTDLLETLLAELVDFCFSRDSRLTELTASVTKPDIFSDAAAVGVEIRKTRTQWEQERTA